MKTRLKLFTLLLFLGFGTVCFGQSTETSSPNNDATQIGEAGDPPTRMNYDDFGNVIGPREVRKQEGAAENIESNNGPVDDFGNPIQITETPPRNTGQQDAPVKYRDTDGVPPSEVNPDGDAPEK